MYTLHNFRDLKALSFSDIKNEILANQADVLNSVDDIRVRLSNLQKAMVLSNGSAYKVNIILKLSNQYYRIETPVLNFDGQNIDISATEKIPLNSIFSFDFIKN